MNLRLCGYFPQKTIKEKRLGYYAKFLAKNLLKNHPKIKTIQLTFFKNRVDFDNGFSWLVKGDRVEIRIGYNFKNFRDAKWLIKHDLFHARQILEGRLNKNLDLVVFTNRKGIRKTFKAKKPNVGQRYYYYVDVETGKKYLYNEPWEMEVVKDVKKPLVSFEKN